MSSCCRNDLDVKFDRRRARKQLKRYRANGPAKETRLLADGLIEAGVTGATLLDVGGGIGALADALLHAGARSAVNVDASRDYLAAADELASERGYRDRVKLRAGDFVDTAAELAPADIVTLDKVVCCYPDAERLVALSTERAQRLYGLVFPQDGVLVRAIAVAENAFQRLGRAEFRTYIHPVARLEQLVRDAGFKPRWAASHRMWLVRVYERA